MAGIKGGGTSSLDCGSCIVDLGKEYLTGCLGVASSGCCSSGVRNVVFHPKPFRGVEHFPVWPLNP